MITLIHAVATDNMIVRLGPDVDLDFSVLPVRYFPIYFGRCVTLTSVASFGPAAPGGTRGNSTAIALSPFGAGPGPTGEARTPRAPGPVLRYGPHREGVRDFLAIRCVPEAARNDGVRISGFRLYGPSFGQQTTYEHGIYVERCIDIEIANMEIAGWGAAGVAIEDAIGADHPPDANPIGGRISNWSQIRVHDSFFHHNQHPADGIFWGAAEGYGVKVGDGAWARIYRNLFDFNRHAIAASGEAGGYWAEENLVLKGGGYHGTVFNGRTHSFDVHGTGCWWSDNLCGDAGSRFIISRNAWQYRSDRDIKLRGRPRDHASILWNIFPFAGQGGAIALNTNENVTIVFNTFNLDTFGQYGVCDFDGDGVDDLFLATGTTWWFSSGGEFAWFFLNEQTERLDQLRFGDFDGDRRCDVVADHNGRWDMSSGGSGAWTPIGRFGRPFVEVRFGRFDPRIRDHRGGFLPTTHAFWRRGDGQWFVTPLSGPDWQPVASSGFPLSELRFGDFTGDGVTDVLAVVGGRWRISESAALPWRLLNPSLHDPVANLIIANVDPDDTIDDIFRLDRQVVPVTPELNFFPVLTRADLVWMRSRNGVEPWRPWRSYRFVFWATPDRISPVFGFAGSFGSAPGGGTLTIDPERFGQFYSPAEATAGRSPDWHSVHAY